jgi:hypothetical protein
MSDCRMSSTLAHTPSSWLRQSSPHSIAIWHGVLRATPGLRITCRFSAAGRVRDEPISKQTLSYTPAIGFSGIDHFRYTIVDRDGALSTATVTITVKAPFSCIQTTPPNPGLKIGDFGTTYGARLPAFPADLGLFHYALGFTYCYDGQRSAIRSPGLTYGSVDTSYLKEVYEQLGITFVYDPAADRAKIPVTAPNTIVFDGGTFGVSLNALPVLLLAPLPRPTGH